MLFILYFISITKWQILSPHGMPMIKMDDCRRHWSTYNNPSKCQKHFHSVTSGWFLSSSSKAMSAFLLMEQQFYVKIFMTDTFSTEGKAKPRWVVQNFFVPHIGSHLHILMCSRSCLYMPKPTKNSVLWSLTISIYWLIHQAPPSHELFFGCWWPSSSP